MSTVKTSRAARKAARQAAKQNNSTAETTTTHTTPGTTQTPLLPHQKTIRNLGVILKYILIAIAAFFIWMNIQPYYGILEKISASSIQSPLMNFLLNLPFIGWALSSIGGVFLALFSVVFWVGFQLCELLPSFLTRNQQAIRDLIEMIQSTAIFLKIESTDHPYIAKLKEQHNRKPLQWIDTAHLISSIAYLADFALCIWYYPPLKSSIDLFFIAPSMDDIATDQVGAILGTVFAVEIIYFLVNWLDDLVKHYSSK